MAKIVLGIATSHSPLMVLEPGEWYLRSEGDRANPKLALSDGREMNYAQLVEVQGEPYGDLATESEYIKRSKLCHDSMDRLARDLEEANPDVVVVIGDDQNELISLSNNPAFAIFYGDKVVTTDERAQEHQPDYARRSAWAYLMDQVHTLPGAKALAMDVIEGLIDRHVDVAALAQVDNPKLAGFGHAFGFIAHRLLRNRPVPMLPVLLNTYYAPNVMRSARAFDIGVAMRDAIEASPLDLRVAVVASGGLSHFVVDEKLDRQVMEGLNKGKHDLLRSIPPEALKSGSSEILNWVMTAGAVADMEIDWSEFVPIYRTPAGTGLGAGFAAWKPK